MKQPVDHDSKQDVEKGLTVYIDPNLQGHFLHWVNYTICIHMCWESNELELEDQGRQHG